MKKQSAVALVVIFLMLIAGCTSQQAESSSWDVKKAVSTEIIELEDGASYTITASAVLKSINGKIYDMYAYNGMIPGPTLKVKQGSRVKVTLENDLSQETTIHWHGLRHSINDDGVPGVSQEPVKAGKSYDYNLYFPDAGMFWYHPHIREDETQDLGLAGNILVLPNDAIYNPVNKEEVIMLDDIYIDSEGIVPYAEKDANFALMGRYGNVMLVNGQTEYSLNVSKGDIVRFYITSSANARPFNVSIQGVKMKLVGSDLGLYEKEEFVSSIIIAPAERYIIEAYFKEPGDYKLISSGPQKSYALGMISAGETAAPEDYSTQFANLNDNGLIMDVSPYLGNEPDYKLKLSVDTAMMMGGRMGMAGMPCHRMPDGTTMGNCEGSAAETELIEWEDTMRMMNYQSNADNTKWIIRDEKTGLENMNLAMSAKIGDKVKIRMFNDPKSMHPMQHPIHLHGQRFLVLSIDGKPVENRVWKDTLLVPIGSTVDILVDVTNPGEWMFHCHIAEHLESGMMAKFIVKE